MRPTHLSCRERHLGLCCGLSGADGLARPRTQRLLGCAPVWLPHWEAGGERTVVLQVGSSREMQSMRLAATAAALPCHVIADAGRTEVAPGTETVLAIAGPTGEVDVITGHLHTLRSTCTTCAAAEAS